MSAESHRCECGHHRADHDDEFHYCEVEDCECFHFEAFTVRPQMEVNADAAGDGHWPDESLLSGDELTLLASARAASVGDQQAWSILVLLDTIAGLRAAQINRPAPDRDLRSKIEALRVAAVDELIAAKRRKGVDNIAAECVRVETLAAVLALLDAGEPPTGSGCA